MEIKHFISHRGNISGAQPDSENTKNYILDINDNKSNPGNLSFSPIA